MGVAFLHGTRGKRERHKSKTFIIYRQVGTQFQTLRLMETMHSIVALNEALENGFDEALC